HVLLHSAVDGSDKAIALDQLGRFSVSVRPGDYDVFVSAQGFAPFSGRFSVVAGKATRVEARLKVASVSGPEVVAPEQPSTSQKRPRDFNEGEASAPAPLPAGQPAQTPAAPPTAKTREFNEADIAPEQAAPAAAPAPASQPSSQAQPAAQATPPPAPLSPREREARDIAVRFAPVFHQRMAGGEAEHRYELCTVFDFDGDWIGNNNWQHAADTQYPIWAFVYYSVSETEDRYYIHYACYHPRDWSLVQGSYDSALDVLQDKYGQIMGSGVRKEVEFNHENDLEGVLVVVDKWGDSGPEVVAAETVAHNHLLRALTADSDLDTPGAKRQALPLENGHPVFYIESQKHGIHPYGGEQSQANQPIVVLRYGPSTELTEIKDGQATYDLVPIKKTFYQHAQETREPNLTYGTVVDFGDRFCQVPGATRPACAIGTIGGALRGDVARPNAAVAPWVWFDLDDKGLPPGSWFFDPASILVRHFGQTGSEKYLYNPYLGIDLGGPEAAPPK
ncbi:MAG TPA: hypothetical protein VMS96_08830, partial [Terriglobales bacterium]|nr:hypothetical protein [Terriglobales bacterium]